MAYSVYTDVASEFKGISFSASSSVTDTEVTSFIAQADALIDSYISNRYSTPVTAAAGAISLLQWISIQIVRERIVKILAVKTGVEAPDQLEPEKPMWQTMLENISKGVLDLAGATLISSGDGVKMYNYDNDIEPTFDVTTNQW